MSILTSVVLDSLCSLDHAEVPGLASGQKVRLLVLRGILGLHGGLFVAGAGRARSARHDLEVEWIGSEFLKELYA